jgi:hypothetical protein
MKLPSHLAAGVTSLEHVEKAYLAVTCAHRITVANLVRTLGHLGTDEHSTSSEFAVAWQVWWSAIMFLSSGRWSGGSTVLETTADPTDQTVENVWVVHPWSAASTR